MSVDFYNGPKKTLNVYGDRSGSVEGVDFRKEMTELLWTEDRGTEIIFRRTQLDDKGHPKQCECKKNNRSREADKDIQCHMCNGFGYYYTDLVTRTLINHSQAYAIYKKHKREGESQVEYKTCYFEWDFLKNVINDGDNIPNRYDKVIQLRKDLDGEILSPSTVREMYEILSVEPYRLDNNGRIEYYRVRIISVIDKSFLV